MNPVTFVLVNLAIIAILWAGGWQVQAGAITQGEVVALVLYESDFGGVGGAGKSDRDHHESGSLRCPGQRGICGDSFYGKGEKTEGWTDEKQPKIVFDHVTFSYGGAQEASLEDISFTVEAGETVGVIGGTGSDNLPLMNLIPRFYDAQQGQILVDGQNVREYSFQGLREKLVVPQKAVLFQGTIRENLCWRKKESTDEELWKALEIAQGKKVVEKKSGGLDRG